MVFIETSLFSRLLPEHLDDEQYRRFQGWIMQRPDTGAVVRGTGGVRKVRWRSRGKGKSGGVRIIYYWARADHQIFLLTIYGKSEKENLTPQDLKRIATLLEELSNG